MTLIQVLRAIAREATIIREAFSNRQPPMSEALRRTLVSLTQNGDDVPAIKRCYRQEGLVIATPASAVLFNAINAAKKCQMARAGFPDRFVNI